MKERTGIRRGGIWKGDERRGVREEGTSGGVGEREEKGGGTGRTQLEVVEKDYPLYPAKILTNRPADEGRKVQPAQGTARLFFKGSVAPPFLLLFFHHNTGLIP